MRTAGRFETEQLLSFLADIKGPLIVTGDFNDEPGGSAYRLFLSRFEDAWMRSRAKGDGLSFPSDKAVETNRLHFYAGRN